MSDSRITGSISRIEANLLDSKPLSEFQSTSKEGNGITIFIPNWNHRSFLPRSLYSALRAADFLEKEGFSAEILVIDDASRDGSQKLVRTVQTLYNEPRLRMIAMHQNHGQARLSNIAFQAARFKYVCRMDADNELLPENLSLFLRSAQQTRATMVYGNLIDKRNDKVVGIRSNMAPTLRLLRANYIDAFSILDAEKVLKLGGYTRVHPYSPDDWEMVLHLIAEEQLIVLVPAVMGYYHLNTLSASQELPNSKEGRGTVYRIYAQTGMREWDDLQVGRIYHPDVGFVDEW